MKQTLDKRIVYSIVILTSLFFALCEVFGWVIPELPYEVNMIPKYLLFFCFGELVRGEELIKNRFVSIMIIVISGILSWEMCLWLQDKGFLWFLMAIIGIIMCVISSKFIDNNCKIVKRILRYCGEMSIAVLCLHGPIYRIIINLASSILLNQTNELRNDFVFSGVITGITFFFCLVFYKIIMSYFPVVIGKYRR